MKKKIILISSLDKSTQVTIRNGKTYATRRHFGSVDKAIAFVVPLGDHRTEFFLNGYPCVLHAWVADSKNHRTSKLTSTASNH